MPVGLTPSVTAPETNPFESPQTEVTSSRIVALRPAMRVLRAFSLGVLGLGIHTGTVYYVARQLGSEGSTPADAWMSGIYMATTFAGSELFVNSQGRSLLRRLAYSVASLFLSAILVGNFLRALPRSSQIVAAVPLFVVIAVALNLWRSRFIRPVETPSKELAEH